MSGIDLLLKTAIDHERTHQITLFTLLSKSKMSEVLLNVSNPTNMTFLTSINLKNLQGHSLT